MVSSANPQPEALTIVEAKVRAGCGRLMIYQEIQSGRLRARKLGRRTLILAADLSAWLANLPLVKP
jgi:excisionase family DNA binding protein